MGVVVHYDVGDFVVAFFVDGGLGYVISYCVVLLGVYIYVGGGRGSNGK